MKKVRQIATDSGSVFALCEDGTMYGQSDKKQGWVPIIGIPDDSQEQQSDVIDATTQEVRKPVSIGLTQSILLELRVSDLCNILKEVAYIINSQAEDCVRERMVEEIISMAEAEDCNEYQNLMLQCNMLDDIAEAVDIQEGADRFIRDEKRTKLIDELTKIQVA